MAQPGSETHGTVSHDTEPASRMIGFLVVSRQEGRQLGRLTRVCIDPESRTLSELCFEHATSGHAHFIAASDVELIGEDVILVDSEESTRAITNGTQPAGRDVQDLIGHWATTMDGQHLGTIVDLELERATGALTGLWLSDHKRLPVSAAEVRIGPDEVLVPEHYAANIQTDVAPPVSSMSLRALPRMLGGQTFEGITTSIRRALGGVRATNGGRKEAKQSTRSATSAPGAKKKKKKRSTERKEA